MKKYFFIILLFQAFGLFASSPLKKGDVLNVWAVHGLPVYEKVNGKQLLLIPYGEFITVDDGATTAPISISIKGAEIKQPLVLKGQWVKIKYKNQVGFVFSGYLSKMPCFKKTGMDFEPDEAYLKRIYGTPKVTIKKTTVKKLSQVNTTKTYKNGIIETELASDGCIDVNLYLNNISYQDGILFEQASLFCPDAATNIKIQDLKNGKVAISYYSCD
ncbi:hypothetical protein BDD43_5841 [Mucilaginibacter gracilis]|uniref:SH3 domain-containing protein n=1 Tax=Mucilaginibacter gracilis TaxID=423350 RepID=A0A495J986_9SPHI|nr:hypothetical protein [Mucilaginibacter gracilis]RKR85570.1 hypothetical protein BDD43_5841 [Mucilaginibacter gracilis]